MLDQKSLMDAVKYNPLTGHFVKIKCRRTDWIGKVAGHVNKKGYRNISINNKLYPAHRLAWLYMTGKWPYEIDHIDLNKSNNRFSNLRECSDSGNMHNQSKRKHNTSGYKGVTYNKHAKKWTAQIRINWEMKYLGLFNCPTAAHFAYCRAAKQYHGEFARTE